MFMVLSSASAVVTLRDSGAVYKCTDYYYYYHGRAIARVHPVHLMNVEWRQAAADPRPSQTT